MSSEFMDYAITDWGSVRLEEAKGETGIAHNRTRFFRSTRQRIVEYSPGYVADHWCSIGHIVYCLRGDITLDFADGTSHSIAAGMSCHLNDNGRAHRISSSGGAKLFIVDNITP